MFENIPVLLSIVVHERDDILVGIGDLDGIGLNMHDRVSHLLHLMLEIDHE